MSCRFSLLAVILLSVGLVEAPPAVADETAAKDSYLSYSGSATAQPAGKLLYRENHHLHFRDGKITARVVLYTCRDGSPFARKVVSYVESTSPDYVLEDASNGMREGIQSNGNERTVFFRNDRVAAEKRSRLPAVPDLVADAGFDEFVRSHWQPLVDGNTMTMNFLVPSRLEAMAFKVQHIRRDVIEGAPVELFRLKLSGVLGWVAPSIDVYYGSSDHILMRYEGVSDLRDASNENYRAEIDFRASDRRPSADEEMSDARSARLSPCK